MRDRVELAAFLARVRARLRLQQGVAEGAFTLAATTGALWLLLIVAGLLGPAAAWRSIAGAILVAALVAGGRAVWRPLSAWRRDAEVARFVDEATGAGDLVLSATELCGALAAMETLGTSTELARAVIAQAVSKSRLLDPRRLVDPRPARRATLTAASVMALWLLALVAFPSLIGRGWAALWAHETALDAASEPILGDLDLELTFPAHTGLPPRSIPGTSGAVLAPPGTEVALHARSLIPVESAELFVEDAAGKVIATRPVEVKSGALQSSFTVAQPGGYRFAIHPPSGRAVREADLHRIDVDPDRAPRVELAAPADDLEVAGPKKVELAWSADDDYGLATLELVWRAASATDGGSEQRRVVRKVAGTRSASGKYEWDLAELDLKPGVRIAYHLEARDNDDLGGPNVGSSRTLYVRIFSPSEKHEELLGTEQALVESAVVLLADRIDADRSAALPDVDSASQLGPTRELDDWSMAHGKTEAFLAELGRTASGIDKDQLAPKDLKPSLAAIHERLGKLSRDEDEELHKLKDRGRKFTLDRASLRPLRDGNPRQVAELERDVLLLDDLINRQRMEELIAVADQMARARDHLKELLEQYKRTRSEALRGDIQRELRDLQRKLAELAEKASRLRGEVPDEFLNREAMGDNDMAKRLDSIKGLLDKGDVDSALAELARMSQSLDKMMQAMEGDLKSFRDERFSAEEKALSELENKLADLEHDERQIQQSSEQLRLQQKTKAQELMQDRVEPFLLKAKQEVAEIKKKLAAVDPQAMAPFDQDQLDQARRGADDLGRSVDQRDLDQARAMARKADRDLKALSGDLRGEEQRQWEGMKQAVRNSRDRVDEADGLARKLADEIDEAFPKPGELLGPSERKQLDDLHAAQEATRKRTAEARQGFERRAREAGASVGEGLKEAERHMEKAGEKLGRGKPSDSAEEAGQAADQLQKLRQDVQQQKRPRQEGGAGGPGSKETVKIPGADEYQGPREFRQDVLDAMKREAPADYKEQVKRYYEELVR